MGRPTKAIRPVEKTVNIPSDTATKVDILLWSEIESKVPHGAWSRYVTALIERDLEARPRMEQRLNQLGKQADDFSKS